MKVLVADDDQITRKVVRALLNKWGYEAVEAEDGDQAWQILQQDDAPRLILADWIMPGIDGPELCRRLRIRSDSSYHYIILLTSRDSKEDIVGGLNAGADDYITKPFMTQELEVRLRIGVRILELQQSLQESLELQRYQARHDPLTGILNHGEILRILEQEIERSRRQNSDLAVIMGDLDHFKKVNDTYGHVAGDAVLVEVAQRIRNNIRLYDTVGRYGGEEFLLVLPGCSAEEGWQIGRRILNNIEQPAIKFQENNIAITISLGLACFKAGGPTNASGLVQAADNALYRAKQNGRNRMEV
ncbi:MAG: GGDEF domain-containing protein [Syntrophomonadaceae bacterium]|mgnify:CR=1 FL=1|jgi:two-component system cell cycle response regulator